MSELTQERLGTPATPETVAIWPAVDVFGNPYDKLNVNVVYVNGSRNFVAVPIGSSWAPSEERSERQGASERDRAIANTARLVKAGGDASIKD